MKIREYKKTLVRKKIINIDGKGFTSSINGYEDSRMTRLDYMTITN